MPNFPQAPPLDPAMMGGAPPFGAPPLGGPPMGLPPMPMSGPESPAAAAMPGMAQLAQEQEMMLMEHERQMAAMQNEMQKQVMLLIASLPTPNPAGEAAVSTPITPMASGGGYSDEGIPPADPSMVDPAMSMQNAGAY